MLKKYKIKQSHCSLVAGALERIPVTGVDQPLRMSTCGQWINRWIDLRIHPRFRVAVSEHHDSESFVTRRIDALQQSARKLTCLWPPAGLTKLAVHVRLGVTYEKSIRGPYNTRPLEELIASIFISCNGGRIHRSVLGVAPQKIIVETIANFVPFKTPIKTAVL